MHGSRIGSSAVDELEIRVRERCHFRVRHEAAGEPPERIEAYDAQGERVPIWTLRADRWMASTFTPLEEGKSPVLSLPEGSYELRFLRGSEVLRSVAVELVPGRHDVLLVD